MQIILEVNDSVNHLVNHLVNSLVNDDINANRNLRFKFMSFILTFTFAVAMMKPLRERMKFSFCKSIVRFTLVL